MGTHHRLWRWSLSALLSAALLACSGDARKDWMPLQAGHALTYDVRFEGDEPVADTEWTLRAEGPREWNGQTVFTRWHSAGVRYFLVSDEQGIRRVAHQTELDTAPVPDEPPVWVLKAPYAVGTEWSAPTVPHLLARRNEYPRELKHSHRAIMQWRIESVSETLHIGDRTLSPCMTVVGTALLNLYTDPVNGFTNVPLISREWYCQGHGLVRLEREEKVPKGFLLGGLLTAQWRP